MAVQTSRPTSPSQLFHEDILKGKSKSQRIYSLEINQKMEENKYFYQSVSPEYKSNDFVLGILMLKEAMNCSVTDTDMSNFDSNWNISSLTNILATQRRLFCLNMPEYLTRLWFYDMGIYGMKTNTCCFE